MPVLSVVLITAVGVGVHAFCYNMSRWPNMSSPAQGVCSADCTSATKRAPRSPAGQTSPQFRG
eukprot:985497-Pyramimonas_sp.AAC.1